jgi:electron transport complex protein RnfB
MDVIIVSVIILCVCGLLAGVALSVASKIFAIEVDSRILTLEKILPGANCSGCGKPSCFAYATEMVENNAEPNLCVMASDKVSEIGKVLGVDASGKEKLVAAIRCGGGQNSIKQYDYSGIPSCQAISFYDGGDSKCEFSCLGFGDCGAVCPFGAVTRDGRNAPVVDNELCVGCGRCVEECPKDIIVLVPESARPLPACKTHEKGKFVKSICPTGCIKCRICIKECPENAIDMKNDIIEIDYEKCNKCGICIEKCPRNIMFDRTLEKNS